MQSELIVKAREGRRKALATVGSKVHFRATDQFVFRSSRATAGRAFVRRSQSKIITIPFPLVA
jgi:hypothetical protein